MHNVTSQEIKGLRDEISEVEIKNMKLPDQSRIQDERKW